MHLEKRRGEGKVCVAEVLRGRRLQRAVPGRFGGGESGSGDGGGGGGGREWWKRAVQTRPLR